MVTAFAFYQFIFVCDWLSAVSEACKFIVNLTLTLLVHACRLS